jgi:hypothetical protein
LCECQVPKGITNGWANSNALLINASLTVYCLFFLPMESRIDRQKSGRFLKKFGVKWKFQGGVTEGIIKNNII